jgi:hypothetical protein
MCLFRNDAFRKELIDVYLLGVFNPNGYVHSQPQSHFHMKQYKEPLSFSFCIFIFIFFFILAKAMSESALGRLRWETKDKEVGKKVEVFRGNKLKKRKWNKFN